MWLRVGLAWGLLFNAVRLGKLLANPLKWNSLPHWLLGPSIWGIAGPNNFDRASYHQTPFLYSMGRPSYFSMKSNPRNCMPLSLTSERWFLKFTTQTMLCLLLFCKSRCSTLDACSFISSKQAVIQQLREVLPPEAGRLKKNSPTR